MSSGMPGTLDAARTPYSLESKQVCWNLTSAPWLPSTLLELTVELLPTIEDNVAVDLIEQLAVLVVERDERIRAQREVQSVQHGTQQTDQTLPIHDVSTLHDLSDASAYGPAHIRLLCLPLPTKNWTPTHEYLG